MRVKVELHQSFADSLPESVQKAELGFPSFSRISLVALEPDCPFCHKELRNLTCSCQSFSNAKRKLLASYGRDGLYVRYGFWPSHSFFVKDHVRIKKTVTPDKHILLFDQGTVFNDLGTTWYVSEGSMESNVLNFYLRKKGSEQFYRCKISHLPDCWETFDINKVKIFLSYTYQVTVVNENAPQGTLGNYHIENREKNVAEFRLGTFLKKLTEI